MIFYLVKREHTYTLGAFLKGLGAELAPRITLLPYERLRLLPALRGGTYIFSDIERLSPQEAEAAARLWEHLAGRPGTRLLNHPTRTLRRYELLRRLHEEGVNDFNVYRLTEGRRPPVRLPAFVRMDDEHRGAQTGLLRTPGEIEEALAQIDREGLCRDNRIVCEFFDTSDAAGIYRKYSAFMIGGAVVARHLFFSRDWMVKYANLADEPLLDEERRYVEGNPHEARLRELFALARVEYGRIDYSLHEGRFQVWEINTNPCLVSPSSEKIAARAPVNQAFARRAVAAFEAVDDGGGESVPNPLYVRVPLKRRLKDAVKLCLGRL